MKTLNRIKALSLVSALTLASSGLLGESTVIQASAATLLPSNTIPTDRNFDIKIVSWQDPTQPYGKAYSYAVQAYEKLHPNVKIENIYQPTTGGGYNQLLDTEFLAKDAPDAMQLYAGWIQQYTNEGDLMLLDGYLSQKTPYSSGQAWIDTYVDGPSAFNTVKAMNQYGAISYLPVDSGPGGASFLPFFYNKTILSKSGVKTLPKTWAQFIAVCAKIKAHGYTPVEADNSRFLQWISAWTSQQMGNGYMNTLFGKQYAMHSLYSDQAAVALLDGKIGPKNPIENAQFTIMQNFSKYWESGWAGITTEQAEQAFIYGKAAFIPDGNWEYPYMQQNVKFSLGLLPFPLLTKQSTKYAAGAMPVSSSQDTYGWGLNKQLDQDPEKLKVVLDFFQFMTSKPIQAQMAKIGLFAPVITGVPAAPSLKPFMATKYNKLVNTMDNVMYTDATNSPALLQAWLTGAITKSKFLAELHQDNLNYAKTQAQTELDPKNGLQNQIRTLQKTLAQETSQKLPSAVIQATEASLKLSALRLHFYQQYAAKLLK